MPPTILVSKKARWLVARDWIVTFLRAPWRTFADKTLVYLYYDSGFALIDRRPNVTLSLPTNHPLCQPMQATWQTMHAHSTWATLTKGNNVAQECLALENMFEQPSRE